MQRVQTTLTTTLFLLLYTAAPTSSARPDPGGGMRPHMPPPEAVDACEGKQADAECSFTGRRNDIVVGTCITPPGLDELACAPEGGPPDHGGRPDRRD